MVSTNSKRPNQLTTDLLTPEAWLKRLESGRPEEDVTLIRQALEITHANVIEEGVEKDSREAQGNSVTMSAYQDALITAELLNELRMDSESIVASLVSNAIHQKQISFETIEKQFGKGVADAVNTCHFILTSVTPNSSEPLPTDAPRWAAHGRRFLGEFAPHRLGLRPSRGNGFE